MKILKSPNNTCLVYNPDVLKYATKYLPFAYTDYTKSVNQTEYKPAKNLPKKLKKNTSVKENRSIWNKTLSCLKIGRYTVFLGLAKDKESKKENCRTVCSDSATTENHVPRYVDSTNVIYCKKTNNEEDAKQDNTAKREAKPTKEHSTLSVKSRPKSNTCKINSNTSTSCKDMKNIINYLEGDCKVNENKSTKYHKSNRKNSKVETKDGNAQLPRSNNSGVAIKKSNTDNTTHEQADFNRNKFLLKNISNSSNVYCDQKSNIKMQSSIRQIKNHEKKSLENAQTNKDSQVTDRKSSKTSSKNTLPSSQKVNQETVKTQTDSVKSKISTYTSTLSFDKLSETPPDTTTVKISEPILAHESKNANFKSADTPTITIFALLKTKEPRSVDNLSHKTEGDACMNDRECSCLKCVFSSSNTLNENSCHIKNRQKCYHECICGQMLKIEIIREDSQDLSARSETISSNRHAKTITDPCETKIKKTVTNKNTATSSSCFNCCKDDNFSTLSVIALDSNSLQVTASSSTSLHSLESLNAANISYAFSADSDLQK